MVNLLTNKKRSSRNLYLSILFGEILSSLTKNQYLAISLQANIGSLER